MLYLESCIVTLRLMIVIPVLTGICTGVEVTVGSAVTVNLLDEAILKCSFTTASTDPSAHWYKKNGTETDLIIEDTGLGFSVQPRWNRHSISGNMDSKVINLRITETEASDSGTYVCRVVAFVDPQDEGLISLTINTPPCKPNLNGSESVNGTMTLTIECWSSCGLTPITYTFQKDGTIVESENGLLVIEYTTKEDEGQYMCYANNTLGGEPSQPLVVTIPYFQPYNGKITYTCEDGGKTIVAKCEFIGNPEEMDFAWFYEGIGGNSTQRIMITRLDSMKLICRASNSIGESDNSSEVVVDCENCLLLCIILPILCGIVFACICGLIIILVCRCCCRERISAYTCCKPLCKGWDDCLNNHCHRCIKCCKGTKTAE